MKRNVVKTVCFLVSVFTFERSSLNFFAILLPNRFAGATEKLHGDMELGYGKGWKGEGRRREKGLKEREGE